MKAADVYINKFVLGVVGLQGASVAVALFSLLLPSLPLAFWVYSLAFFRCFSVSLRLRLDEWKRARGNGGGGGALRQT